MGGGGVEEGWGEKECFRLGEGVSEWGKLRGGFFVRGRVEEEGFFR